MGKTQKKGTYTFSTTNGIWSAIAVIAMLPSAVMMISFAMEGNLPPPAPFFIFGTAFLLLGFKSALVLDETNNHLYHKAYIWQLPIRSSIITNADIQHVYLHSSTHNEIESKRNDYTEEYETYETGRVKVVWHLKLVIKNHIYRLPWKENTQKSLHKLGKVLAKKLNITYHPPNKKPPQVQAVKQFSFARVFWSGVFLIVVYAFIDTHREQREFEILSQERAGIIGLAKKPDLLEKPLQSGQEIMVFCPVYYTWYVGEVETLFPDGPLSVKYQGKYGMPRTRKFERDMIRALPNQR